jgi:hypothetical protein
VGTINLTGEEFKNWFGLTNAKASCELLGDAGFPGTVNSSISCQNLSGNVLSTRGSVVVGHAWVMTNGKAYDPARKKYTYITGLIHGNTADHLKTITSFDRETFLNSFSNPARSHSSIYDGYIAFNKSARVNDARNGARDKIEELMVDYWQKVSTHMSANWKGKSTRDIVGGRRLIRLSKSDLALIGQNSILAHSTEWYSYSGNNTFSNALRTKVTFGGRVCYLEEIYGRLLKNTCS